MRRTCSAQWHAAAVLSARTRLDERRNSGDVGPETRLTFRPGVRENAPMLERTGPVGRTSEIIVRRIKKQISNGRLAEGHKLPAEREMARQFKTSRVSVREAYRSLEEQGLLHIRRGAEG